MKRGAAALLFHLGLQNRSKDEWRKGVSPKPLRTREERKQKEERRAATTQLHFSQAFTIVELLTVIVIIAILAAITIISYNGITNRTKESSLKTELSQAAKKLETEKIKSGTEIYPSTLSAAGVSQPSNVIFTYNGGGLSSYCLQGTYETYVYHVLNSDTAPKQGSCPVIDGTIMQTVVTSSCPTTRTMAVDARDNHTYWIQKLGDGRCWMLTNLAYAGGGTNTYGDIRTMKNGTDDTAIVYTSSRYYIPADANPTSNPVQPSISTTGSGQYGYLYNFCAANGGQIGNGACSNTSSADVDTSISVCPVGWRLPTGGTTGELQALANAIDATNNATGSVNLRNIWLAQYSGSWVGGLNSQGSQGIYWSSTQNNIGSAYFLLFQTNSVNPSVDYAGYNKYNGRAVRCIAQL